MLWLVHTVTYFTFNRRQSTKVRHKTHNQNRHGPVSDSHLESHGDNIGGYLKDLKSFIGVGNRLKM